MTIPPPGLRVEVPLVAHGTPEQIRQAVDAVIAAAPPRFILGADCTVPAETPWDNLKAAIDAAHAHTPSAL